MPINLSETFRIATPIQQVWEFMLDPRQVVTCMPGAALDDIVDDRTFVGAIRVKVGPIVTSYKGRVQFVDIDAAGYRIEMVAEGRESGGSGNARATMRSNLTALPDGTTEVTAEASAEITGRVMQFGQSMIEGVSHQLFLDFVKRTRERLEADGPATQASTHTASEAEPISIIAVVVRTIWAAITGLFRRILRLGRSRVRR